MKICTSIQNFFEFQISSFHCLFSIKTWISNGKRQKIGNVLGNLLVSRPYHLINRACCLKLLKSRSWHHTRFYYSLFLSSLSPSIPPILSLSVCLACMSQCTYEVRRQLMGIDYVLLGSGGLNSFCQAQRQDDKPAESFHQGPHYLLLTYI